MHSSPIDHAPVLARDAQVAEDSLIVDLQDGRTLSVPLGWYPRLAYGTARERANWELLGDGYGIHWPELDEDISIDALVAGRRSMEGDRSFATWRAGIDAERARQQR
jgi:hypothetical protein